MGNQACLEHAEVISWVASILGIPWAQPGNAIFHIAGVGIGNPYGKVALSAVLIFEELRRRRIWERFPPAWAQGISLDELLAVVIYVDDARLESKLLCWTCMQSQFRRTFTVTFEVQEHGPRIPFCDLYSLIKNGLVRLFPKPKSPLLGQKGFKLSTVHPNGRAPFWCKYSPTTLTAIFAGAQKRAQTITLYQKDRIPFLWTITAGFLQEGYGESDLTGAWGRCEWSEDKNVLLSLIRCAARRGFFHHNKIQLEVIKSRYAHLHPDYSPEVLAEGTVPSPIPMFGRAGRGQFAKGKGFGKGKMGKNKTKPRWSPVSAGASAQQANHNNSNNNNQRGTTVVHVVTESSKEKRAAQKVKIASEVKAAKKRLKQIKKQEHKLKKKKKKKKKSDDDSIIGGLI